MSTIDDVFSTVREAREDGPEALAALAVSYGAAALGGALRVGTLHGHLREARGYITSCEATLESERAKLDAARDEAKAARQRMEEVREQCDRARDDAEMCARQRDEARARASMLAQDLARVEAERDEAREALAAKDSAPDLDYPARAEVWKLRESVDALRSRAERAEAERDESMAAHDYTREALATAGKVTAQAVREREAFSLRLSAAERERDEARAERDASDERWATVCRECDVALAERDAVQALHAELVATRADFGHQRNITEDALRERDDARAALDLARESAREAREEIAGALALVDEARARVEAIAVERNAIVSELSQATDAMMQARAECDALRDRPTYEARTVAPTPEELAAHEAVGGLWLILTVGQRYHVMHVTTRTLAMDVVPQTWIALDARGLPCAWPVVP